MSKVPCVEHQVLPEKSVRDTDFCVYVMGRKEIMILDYPLQIEISLYMLEIQISKSIWKEERKGENPPGLSITDTDLHICYP